MKSLIDAMEAWIEQNAGPDKKQNERYLSLLGVIEDHARWMDEKKYGKITTHFQDGNIQHWEPSETKKMEKVRTRLEVSCQS